MSITPEQWAAFLTVAEIEHVAAGDRPAENQIIGRSISFLVDRLVKFWGRHKATLLPFLSTLAIAALNSLVAAQTEIDQVNPPGPP